MCTAFSDDPDVFVILQRIIDGKNNDCTCFTMLAMITSYFYIHSLSIILLLSAGHSYFLIDQGIVNGTFQL